MAVRRTQRLLRFSSVRQGYGGDVSRALKERQQFQQLRVDDEFRGALGLPTWLRTDADAERHERSKRERKQRVLSRKTEAPEDFGSLHSSGLSSHLCRVLRRQGITDLTDVQHELMKAVGSGTDIILQAHTGTGKSFGLILALAHMLVEDPPDLRFHALVLVPSAGLAGQMERWLRLYCGQSPHMCQLLTSDRSPQQNLANLQAVRPFVVISTPDELQLMASLAKEREKGTPGVMYQLRRNMQLLVIDEVDQVLPPDVGDPLHRSRTQLMQSIVRGSDTSTLGHSHWMPRQQVIAASATLTRHLHGHVRRWMRTELTGEVAAGPAQPSAGFSADGGRRRALVRCISGDGTVGTTNLQSCLPPQLHCALLMSTSAKDVAAAIRSIVQSFVDTGSFHTAGMRCFPPAPTQPTEDTPPNFSALFFPEPGLEEATLRMLQQGLGMAAAIMAGDHKHLVALQRRLEAQELRALVVPRSSSRGLDFLEVSHVFVLGRPVSHSELIHLVGRTARRGQRGLAVIFCGAKDAKQTRDVCSKVLPHLAVGTAAALHDHG